MATLYSNENFPLQVVEALRALGHDVLKSLEAGQANQSIPDDQVLAYATARGRALLFTGVIDLPGLQDLGGLTLAWRGPASRRRGRLTLNRRDFIGLHQSHPAHAGLIVCTQDPDVLGQAERIHKALEGQARLAGQLLRVNRPLR